MIPEIEWLRLEFPEFLWGELKRLSGESEGEIAMEL
jgi:hypothetical protein